MVVILESTSYLLLSAAISDAVQSTIHKVNHIPIKLVPFEAIFLLKHTQLVDALQPPFLDEYTVSCHSLDTF